MSCDGKCEGSDRALPAIKYLQKWNLCRLETGLFDFRGRPIRFRAGIVPKIVIASHLMGGIAGDFLIHTVEIPQTAIAAFHGNFRNAFIRFP